LPAAKNSAKQLAELKMPMLSRKRRPGRIWGFPTNFSVVSTTAVVCQSEAWFAEMAKAVDTGNLSDAPSAGAAALMEALGGLSAVPEASSTAPEPIAVHAHEQTGSPSKTVAQVLGEITWLMTQSPRHKAMPLGDLEWLLMPAILLRQFRIFYRGEQPVGVALWALADELVAKPIDAGDRRLAAVEWKSGINMRIVDIVAPFGGEAEMREQVSGSVNGGNA
jgi:cytolysin-activating lysine-acyltransferase